MISSKGVNSERYHNHHDYLRDSEEDEKDVDAELETALLQSKPAMEEKMNIHKYFYNSLSIGVESALAQSLVRRNKILNQQKWMVTESFQGIYSDKPEEHRVSNVMFDSNPLYHVKSTAESDFRVNRKHFGIRPGWEKGLKSIHNHPKTVHDEFYTGIAQATATGFILSRSRIAKIKKQIS